MNLIAGGLSTELDGYMANTTSTGSAASEALLQWVRLTSYGHADRTPPHLGAVPRGDAWLYPVWPVPSTSPRHSTWWTRTADRGRAGGGGRHVTPSPGAARELAPVGKGRLQKQEALRPTGGSAENRTCSGRGQLRAPRWRTCWRPQHAKPSPQQTQRTNISQEAVTQLIRSIFS